MWRNIQFMPEQASDFAAPIDLLFFVLTALTVVFTALVVALVLFFSIKYRRGAKVDRSNPLYHDTRLELAWSVGPLVLGLLVFLWGAKLFADIRQPPSNAREVFVIGKRWMWHIQHASNGIRENNELHIPIGEPVKFTMISQDVIHDFFIPAFRIHQDVVPGRYTTEWCTPTKIGKYHIFCSQYCGTKHSEMVGTVTVLSKEDFAAWVKTGGQKVPEQRPTMEQEGEELFTQQNCGSCHGAVDTVRGPSLNGTYGTMRPLADGTTTLANEEYIRNAIVDPGKMITKGYKLQGSIGSTMPEYTQLKEDQILSLIAYIRSLKTNTNATITETAPLLSKPKLTRISSPALGTPAETAPNGATVGATTSTTQENNNGSNTTR